MAIIEVKNLTKYYGRSRGVEDLSFEVREGEIFGFLGPNGSGKTTTIRLMLDFIRPNKGEIKIFGFDAKDDAVAIHRQVGYVSSEPFLYPYMKGRDLLRWLKIFRPCSNDLPWARLFEIFRFDPNRFIKNYSSGNRKKLALIQALIHRPRLLILDEPTNGLDPIMKQNFYALLRSLKRQGVTIFFSSHDLTEVQKICDRAAVVKDGRIVAVEEISELIGKSGTYLDVAFQDAPPQEVLLGFDVVSRNGNIVRLKVTGSINQALQRISQYPIADINITKPTLEDIFLTWYKT